jgi:uncharacterized coiled-coil protein SlyX
MFSFINRELIRRKNTVIADLAAELTELKRSLKRMEEQLRDCNERSGYRFEHNAFDQAKKDVSRLEKENESLKTQLALQQERIIQLNANHTALQQTLKTKLCRAGK